MMTMMIKQRHETKVVCLLVRNFRNRINSRQLKFLYFINSKNSIKSTKLERIYENNNNNFEKNNFSIK